MITLKLNQQQSDTLNMLILGETMNQDTSKKYNVIMNQILDKLLEAQK